MGEWETLGQSNEWYTPPEVFEALGCRFDLDVAAPTDLTHVSVPANNFITSRSLDREWHGFVWMNPPFGGRNELGVWLAKFLRHGNGIALTPDRTSAPWFQAAWPHAELVLFTRKLSFIRPDGSRAENPATSLPGRMIGHTSRSRNRS